MRYLILFLCLSLLSFDVKEEDSPSKKEILEALGKQTDCWNSGDLDCFMQTYWHSDSVVFVGSRGLTYGWQNTLDNYKKGYPDKEAMGILNFEILKIDEVSADACFVIGKWHLTRSIGDVGGHFSLLWKKIDDRWVIVADHSS